METDYGDIGGYQIKEVSFTDLETKHTLMIDNGFMAPQILATIQKRELTLIGLGLTHRHTDHAGGLEAILAERPMRVYPSNRAFNLLPPSHRGRRTDT